MGTVVTRFCFVSLPISPFTAALSGQQGHDGQGDEWLAVGVGGLGERVEAAVLICFRGLLWT